LRARPAPYRRARGLAAAAPSPARYSVDTNAQSKPRVVRHEDAALERREQAIDDCLERGARSRTIFSHRCRLARHEMRNRDPGIDERVEGDGAVEHDDGRFPWMRSAVETRRHARWFRTSTTAQRHASRAGLSALGGVAMVQRPSVVRSEADDRAPAGAAAMRSAGVPVRLRDCRGRRAQSRGLAGGPTLQERECHRPGEGGRRKACRVPFRDRLAAGEASCSGRAATAAHQLAAFDRNHPPAPPSISGLVRRHHAKAGTGQLGEGGRRLRS